jgi:F-type H+-transporting ATPase subunit c
LKRKIFEYQKGRRFGVNKKLIMILAVLALFASVSAFAQGAGTTTTTTATGVRWGVIGAAFVLGIAAAAGAIGQGRAIAASVEAIARNPSAAAAIRLSMIIGLALIESLVIYALVLAFTMFRL